jgi:hypothetical protein
VGTAAATVLLPKRVYAPAVDNVKDSAGVVVAVATEVVNNGFNVPAEKVVTVPFEAGVAQTGKPLDNVNT